MVHIINGEIVPDDDPRVRARFQAPSSASAAARPGGFGSASAAAGGGPQPAAAAAAPSPLAGLSRQLGLEGSVPVPAVAALGLPARRVAKLHLALAALLVALFGWRALAVIALAYFVSSQQPAAAAGPQPSARPQPPARPQRGGFGSL